MTQSLTAVMRAQLYDHHDEVKAVLSELNQSKSLVINGPDVQLIERGLNISFYRGQKKAIDAVNTLLDNHEDDDTFHNHYEEYVHKIIADFTDATQNFELMRFPEDDFATVITTYYSLKGQKSIIDSLNKLVTRN